MVERDVSVVLAHAAGQPIYRQIEQQIRALIVAGEVSEGEELPSIRGLARDLQVSVITVKRAYDELEAQGFLESVPGKGCYASVKNRELFREQRLRMIDEKLEEAVADARAIGLGLEDLVDALTILYVDGGDGSDSRG